MIYFFHFMVDYAEIVFMVRPYVDCLSCFLSSLDCAKMAIGSNNPKSDVLLNFPGCFELKS